jgi:hypothetical protein
MNTITHPIRTPTLNPATLTPDVDFNNPCPKFQ